MRDLAADHEELMALQVAWYQVHGKHARRIALSGSGDQYVEGDESWNRKSGNPVEYVEPQMNAWVTAHIKRKIVVGHAG